MNVNIVDIQSINRENKKMKTISLMIVGLMSLLIFFTVDQNYASAEREYEYEFNYDDYEDKSEDYSDDSDTDQEYDSENKISDVKQYNKDGNNYVIIESKQEGIIDKVANFADKILFDEKSGGDYFNADYEKEDIKGHSGSDFRLNVIVAINEDYDSIPDLTVTANGKEKELTKRIGQNEFKTSFKFDNINKEKIKVCVIPDDMGQEYGKCKNAKVEYGNEKTVRFYIS